MGTKLMLTHEEYDRLVVIRREVSHYHARNANIKVNPRLVHMVCAWLDTFLGREGRLKFLGECFGREIQSSNLLMPGEAMGLLMWCKPSKNTNLHVEPILWHPSKQFLSDVRLIQKSYGQKEMKL